jgi:glycine cleavage system H protein
MAHSTHHIIPENERFCVWMDAGIADYKLCPLEFKCEECEFDAQIRKRKDTPRWNEKKQPTSQRPTSVDSSTSADDACTQTLQRVLVEIDQTPLPSDRMYSTTHAWAKSSDDAGGLFLVGIDHFMGVMLASAHSVACSMPGTHVKAGEPYAWIVANGETLALHAPMAGTVSSTNHTLTDRTSVLHTDPYGNGWIAKIIPDDASGMEQLKQSDEMLHVMVEDRNKYEYYIQAELLNLRKHLAGTMYDGGTVLDNFEDILGTKKYYAILEQFLRP